MNGARGAGGCFGCAAVMALVCGLGAIALPRTGPPLPPVFGPGVRVKTVVRRAPEVTWCPPEACCEVCIVWFCRVDRVVSLLVCVVSRCARMAASSGAPRLVRLDHLLDAWSEPSCKAKTDGRYNTNSLAFDDKRAQIASTVMNAAGIHVDRKRDGRANPSDMDQ